ncbi:MAG: hypothetical protein KJ645_09650 [Planctomycetes bacterium]|nr:hypothetical protein [Planctomycetota bacterium]
MEIPLLFWVPSGGSAFQGSCDEVVSPMDVAPTLIDLTGIEIPSGLEGLSLKRVIQGREKNLDRNHPVFTEYILGVAVFVSACQEGLVSPRFLCVFVRLRR